MLQALTIIQVFVSIGIVALVLLQRGRGADAGAGFGAGASGSVFGARGATTGLSRSTAVLAAIFMLNSLALAWFGTRPATDTSRGLLGDTATEVTVPAAPAPAAPSAPTGIPATAPATAPAAPAAPSP
ncbi:MAG: preprotein translocase subunit SecG [Gammaproteobacteria bacterium]|jgi:preprotein translocase subunit SecG